MESRCKPLLCLLVTERVVDPASGDRVETLGCFKKCLEMTVVTQAKLWGVKQFAVVY